MRQIQMIRETGEDTHGFLSADDLPTDVIDARFVHSQASAASVWYIQHNLGKYPSYSVTDIYGNVVVPDGKVIDINTIQLTFRYPSTGYAYLS